MNQKNLIQSNTTILLTQYLLVHVKKLANQNRDNTLKSIDHLIF